MNLQQLKYIKALHQGGSFVAAAEQCSVTQPTLSAAVAQLETELGQKIFERTTRSVRLTPFGEALMPIVNEVLAGVQRVQELAFRHGGGANKLTVRVGISPVVGIRQATSVFEPVLRDRSDFEIVYAEENLEGLCRMLRSGQLDIVIAPIDIDSPDVVDCVYVLLQRDPLLFVPRQETAHFWHNRDSVDIHELSDHQFVLVPNACGLTRVTKRHFDERKLKLHRYPGEASSYRVVQEWANLGLGSGILPASKIEAEGPTAAIPIVENGVPLTIDYYAFGKPNTISSGLFADVWNGLTKGRLERSG
jgi:DNA-binding transcriptional LysR family regulator